ncbi:unnamed protein product, partial [marine sediment metagenome]
SGNLAEYGGAMVNYGFKGGDSSPSLINVTFSGNSADTGGAIFNDGYNGNSSPLLTNVTFSGNSAGDEGGAMYNGAFEGGISSPILTNVLFSGNSTVHNGGAMYNNGLLGISNPILTNVTFSGNKAGDNGGGIFNFESNPKVRNSILWNNMDISGIGTISSSIHNYYGARTYIAYSLVQGTGKSGSESWIDDKNFVDGGGNIDSNPLFITPVNPFDAPSSDGNLRLKTGSPAIDSGENTYVDGVLTDLDGKARKMDGDGNGTKRVDMGAYEYQIEYLYDGYLPMIFR